MFPESQRQSGGLGYSLQYEVGFCEHLLPDGIDDLLRGAVRRLVQPLQGVVGRARRLVGCLLAALLLAHNIFQKRMQMIERCTCTERQHNTGGVVSAARP